MYFYFLQISDPDDILFIDVIEYCILEEFRVSFVIHISQPARELHNLFP
jgi:hypothetical protein